MRAADTNVLVRVLLKEAGDRQYVAALSVFAEDVWVSHLVLAETFWVLTRVYGYSRAAWSVVLGQLLQHERLVFEDQGAVVSALERYRGAAQVGFMDCLVLEVALKAGHGPLYTFDKQLGKQDGTVQL